MPSFYNAFPYQTKGNLKEKKKVVVLYAKLDKMWVLFQQNKNKNKNL